ncbi:amino acid ABC transporter substrate-binding protein [Thalassotalea sp. M1531]|uniref:Amino acid ABC transporter substrate-binding protein n=1 Tax=Thalassotalea algicola TaxID=2716224 RepID=A0A7Y0Q6L3_9GAMM|nr:transporter substrate-binding domain-containing protein [Thalassotalea algicola]NMP31488.1 amino acid ABC transporter substrate-binding protein [Thalassotalea algicola]
MKLTWVKIFVYIVILCGVLHKHTFANEEIFTITIPGPLSGQEVRNPFIEELLHLIFDKEGKQLELEYLERDFSKGRALKELEQGEFFDLNWSATSIQQEQELLAIKIPIYQGLIGWRILLIRKSDQAKFAQIKKLTQLKDLVAVQRFDWADYDILKENGLQVEGSLSFENHSLAVIDGIADYFPRSVLEVIRESKTPRNKQLIIEQSLLLKYPSANYFFVNKNNQALASLIKKGFDKALIDGSYAILFQKHFGDMLKALNLEKRYVLQLKNSQFPPSEHMTHYWYNTP